MLHFGRQYSAVISGRDIASSCVRDGYTLCISDGSVRNVADTVLVLMHECPVALQNTCMAFKITVSIAKYKRRRGRQRMSSHAPSLRWKAYKLLLFYMQQSVPDDAI